MLDDWNGNWQDVNRWVRTLYPRGLTTEEEVEEADFPHAIRFYAGSMQNLPLTKYRVEVFNYEEEDAIRMVNRTLAELLNSVDADRTSITVKLDATILKAPSIDEEDEDDGDDDDLSIPDFEDDFDEDDLVEEVTWKRAGTCVQNFTRNMTRAPSPSPLQQYGNNPPPVPGAATGARGPGPRTLASPSFTSPAREGSIPGSGLHIDPEAIDKGISARDQVYLHTINTILGENRFLVNRLDGLMSEVINVHRESVRASKAEGENYRESLDKSSDRIAKLQVNHANAKADAQHRELRARLDRLESEANRTQQDNQALAEQLQAERQAREQERQANEAEAKRLREAADAARRTARRRRALSTGDDGALPEGVQDRVGAAADMVIDKVLKGLSEEGGGGQQQQPPPQQHKPANGGGRPGWNGVPGAPPSGGGAHRTAQQQASPQQAPPQQAPPQQAPPQQAPPQHPGGGFNPANIDPSQAAVLLRFMAPEQRRAVLNATVKSDRNFAIRLTEELADAVEEHDVETGTITREELAKQRAIYQEAEARLEEGALDGEDDEPPSSSDTSSDEDNEKSEGES